MASGLPPLERLALTPTPTSPPAARAAHAGRKARRDEAAPYTKGEGRQPAALGAWDDDRADDQYQSEDDDDRNVPVELQHLDPAGAERRLRQAVPEHLLPSRRSPDIRQDVLQSTGPAGELLRLIQSAVMKLAPSLQSYWCGPDVRDKSIRPFLTPDVYMEIYQGQRVQLDKAYKILEKYTLDDKSWIRSAYFSLRGQIHTAIVPEQSFRTLYDAYVAFRGGDPWFMNDMSKLPGSKVFTQVKWESDHEREVGEALAPHAHLFAPMIDALHAFGFVAEGQDEFQIRWRFHPLRHNNASMWHFDSNGYMMYGDESMQRATRWTKEGNRSVATTSCLSIDPSQPADRCGTRILSGLPMLREEAVHGIVDELWDAKDTYPGFVCPREKEAEYAVQFRKEVADATEQAIKEFTASPDVHDYTRTAADLVRDQARGEAVLASAGVEVMRVRNGEISTFNDHQYHAGSTTPPGQIRLFFIANTGVESTFGEERAYKEHTRIVDGQGRVAKIMFTLI